MKILILNGYKQTNLGKKKFKQFVELIQEAFSHHKYTLVGKLNFIIRDLSNIDEFLYESYAFGQRDDKKRFDSIDFIFIDGESNLLPWSPAAK
jgi:hypothetical protein